ncbi:MAG: ABC transporter substrate-binding protein [Candidatus Competibacteraceae bacterium]|nr:ABC transporter substrate-binding protein [Candidatus Competibacteraceae bacterium]
MLNLINNKIVLQSHQKKMLKLCYHIPFLLIFLPLIAIAEDGVTDTVIRIGSTQPLKGDLSPIGQGMKLGMDAGFKNAEIRGRSIELVVLNDSYNPATTVEAAGQLIEQGIFLMLGSTGSQTMKAVLPLLAEHQVPAVGFYTGAGFEGPGEVLNFRASYVQEVVTAVNSALAAGVQPTEVCAYVQNDAYGMAGLAGVKQALDQQDGTEEVVAILDQILNMAGDDPKRNNLGPVGVNQRGTLTARSGYMSLKEWEKKAGTSCRFVVTVLNTLSTVQFIGYANQLKGEEWVFSVPSPAVGEVLLQGLGEQKVNDKVIATGVLPVANTDLPIVQQARQALGSNFNAFSLEGYAVSQMVLAILNNIQGDLTRANFLQAARSQPYDLGGVSVDFTTDNQGSNFVQLTTLKEGGFIPITPTNLNAMFQ